jgi:hypothetical protein
MLQMHSANSRNEQQRTRVSAEALEEDKALPTEVKQEKTEVSQMPEEKLNAMPVVVQKRQAQEKQLVRLAQVTAGADDAVCKQPKVHTPENKCQWNAN